MIINQYTRFKTKYYKGRKLKIAKENIFVKLFLGGKDMIYLYYTDENGDTRQVCMWGMRDVIENGEKRIQEDIEKRRLENLEAEKRRKEEGTNKTPHTNYYFRQNTKTYTDDYDSNEPNEEYDESCYNSDYDDDDEKSHYNITNQMYGMNRTDSPFTVEDITPDKYEEEFFYDFNKEYNTFTNSDIDRYY